MFTIVPRMKTTIPPPTIDNPAKKLKIRRTSLIEQNFNVWYAFIENGLPAEQVISVTEQSLELLKAITADKNTE